MELFNLLEELKESNEKIKFEFKFEYSKELTRFDN